MYNIADNMSRLADAMNNEHRMKAKELRAAVSGWASRLRIMANEIRTAYQAGEDLLDERDRIIDSQKGDDRMIQALVNEHGEHAFLALTMPLAEHPEAYEGPCLCLECMSYA